MAPSSAATAAASAAGGSCAPGAAVVVSVTGVRYQSLSPSGAAGSAVMRNEGPSSVMVTQVKLVAAFSSPPVYCGQLGYSQIGRVRPAVSELVSVATSVPGSMPSSTHACKAGKESNAGTKGPKPWLKPGIV